MARENKQRSLRVGAQVFYPSHGVARVIGIEERAFGEAYQMFFALELDGGNRVLLPVNNVERAGVRELVSATRARKMLELVISEPEAVDSSSRRQRVIQYKDSLRSGSADSYTSVLQALLDRSRTKKLASDEKRVMEEARGYFVAEVSAVLSMSRADVLGRLAKD